MASGPGKVVADGETQVMGYLQSEGFSKEEIEDALDLAAETTPSYVIVGARPDALYFEYGDYRIEEGGEYLESDGTWDG
ncbi:MAG TPA: hypothetical protein VEH31_27530 [Streptosporangiaceae bacterium]|jgi:hypothetical protein|nr:hypothetical protein [Streptosporangiaceae bacterium]